MPKSKLNDQKKKHTIVQCTRCQRYGHTKTYCRRQHSCVKCGNEHNTANSPKSPDTPAKCALRAEDHPYNYKGCKIYQEILQKRNSTTQKPHWYRTQSTHENPAPEQQQHSETPPESPRSRRTNLSYA